jgi:rSAM/selenodomain-associated transferase 1
MQFPDARILIFAKAPEPGLVKTRLIPALGAQGAAELAGRLLLDTVAKVVAAGLCPVQLWCAPDSSHPLFQDLASDAGLTLHTQEGGDLGGRMRHAAHCVLQEAASVLLIGTDCPPLHAGHLQQALQWLAQGADAVLGPAEDGGYVLLGIKAAPPLLFSGVSWGSDEVLAQTRQRLGRLGWCWQELEVLWDLDCPADLERLSQP